MKRFFFILLCFLIPYSLFSQANDIRDSLKSLLKNTNEYKEQIKLLNKISYEFLNDNVDSAMYYAELAYQKAQKYKYETGIANSELNFGSVSETQGDYQTAIEKFHKALQTFKHENDTFGIMLAYSNLSLTHYYLEDPDKSLAYSKLALYEARKIKYADTGNMYNVCGLAYLTKSEFDTALFYFMQSKIISEGQDLVSGVAYSLGNMANVYLATNDYEKALSYYLQVKEISEKQNDRISLSLSHVNISNVYVKLAENSENEFEKESYYKSAVENAEKSLFYAQEIKSLAHINYAYYQLMVSYKGSKDFERALVYAEKYIGLTDSILNIDKIKEIENLESKYKLKNITKEKQLKEDVIKKQDQIIFLGTAAIFLVILLLIFVFVLYKRMKHTNTLLNQKNTDIENQRAEIAGQRDNLSELAFELKMTNKTKDKFFSVLAHDLKNPFQSILGFSELLKAQADKNDFSNTKQYADIIFQTGKKTYSLLENLLNWARFQRGMIKFNPENCKLSDIIADCAGLAKENADAKEITIEYNIPDDLQVFIDVFLVSTVIRNLLSNAIKFTNRGGRIIIDVKERPNNKADIFVIDNGIGIKQEKIDKIFKLNISTSEKGTENETGTGIGLLVCKEFAKKNNGDLNVISAENEGSTFVLTVLKSKSDE